MRMLRLFLICFAAFSMAAVAAFGQGARAQHGKVVVPQSNVELPENIGKSAHTKLAGVCLRHVGRADFRLPDKSAQRLQLQ